ncbi:tigger transposable element-derived protein 4-like [Sipha flava]|uniref:Tigger transposable element-derived protein 4-like n=1 Tax=Sipha flava TaxID=143950 RepID=A0A8B8FYV0_9HEMI|nr:tigger transposable element-derived protein 4-like [Sipha flava]
MSKRKCLSIADKFEILNEVDKGIKKKDIAERYGIPTSSLSTILKNRENIIRQVESNNLLKNRKRIKVCVYEKVDKAVLKWIASIHFAQKLGFDDFRASSGWLDKFKSRHNIMFKVICGKSVDISEEDNETGLFFKCLPNQTLDFKHEKCFSGKRSKERITLLVCSNMTGTEKQKLLIIGENKNPRCFKGIKSLETNYDFNKKAWMTSNIFEKWLLDIDRKMSLDKRKIILFVRNCTAHPRTLCLKLKSITLAYFPSNISKLQPMNQGIINNLKVYYRKRILNKVISNNKNNITITLRDCISEVSKAWSNDVASEIIKKCFSRAGFKKMFIKTDVKVPDVQQEWDIDQCNDMTLQDYLKIDEDITVYESPIDDDIVEDVKKKENSGEDRYEDENESAEELPKLTEEEILNAFSVVRNGLRFTMALYRILLRYVPMVTFPVAFVVGIIGYNLEHSVRNVETPSKPSILEEKLKRKRDDPNNVYEEPPVLERNLSPPLIKHQ